MDYHFVSNKSRDMRRGEPLGQCRRPVDIEVC